MKRQEVGTLSILFVIYAAFAPTVAAQTSQCVVRGTLADPSGAPVAGAVVTLTNDRTSYTRKVLTDSDGAYEFTFVDPDPFTITAEARGFKQHINRGIPLTSSETKRVDIRMEVGDLNTRITVDGQAPVIDTDTPQITRTMNSRDIDYFSVSPIGGDGPGRLMSGTAPGSGVGQLGFYGSRDNQTKFLMNGVESDFYALYMPTDSVGEVKLFAVNAPAEFPSPNALAMVTKGGSNQVHGLAGLTYRNTALYALNASLPPGSPRPPGTPRETYHARLSGPVFFPRIYNGKNKTFFDFTIEGDPPTTARGPFANTVPTQVMKGGDLSVLGKIIRDPTTGQPFANSVIPSNRLSTVSQQMLKLYPDPNAGAPGQVAFNLAQVYAAPDNYRKYVARFDHNISSNDIVTGFWTGWKTDSSYPVATGGAGVGGILSYGLNISDGLNQQWEVGETHIFSPTVLNELRFGWLRQSTGSLDNAPLQSRLTQFGLQGVTNSTALGGPQVSISGYAGLRTNGQSQNDLDRIHILDNVSVRTGRHSIKAGAEVRLFRQNLLQAAATTGGQFIFNGFYTGDAFADFLLGVPQEADRTTPRPALAARYAEWGAFVQDEFQVSPKLTIQYGLRYALTTVVRDANGLFFNFDPKTGSIVVPDQGALAAVAPAWPKNVSVITAAQAGFPGDLRYGDHTGFLPRVGIAYRPFANGRTVVRSGYGIYAIPLSYAALQTAGPFSLTENYLNSIGPNGVPAFSFPMPFSGVVGTTPTPSATAIDPNYRVPYTQQWNLTVEREIGAQTGVRVSYIGAKDTKLGYQFQLNSPPPSTIPFSAARRPYPGLVNVIGVRNGGNNSYNALDSEIYRRMANGLQFKSGWTWAKDITDLAMTRFQNELGPMILNPFDRAAERGNAEYVPRHKWVTEFVWDAPVGKGRRYLSQLPAAANHLLGGWTVSSTISANSSGYFSPTYSGYDPSNTGVFTGRPDVVAGCDPVPANPNRDKWFNAACFSIPATNAGRFGNAGRGILRGPTAFGIDAALFKRFQIYERLGMRFEATATDVLNHPAFGLPVADITAPNVGKLTSTVSSQGLFQGVPLRRIYFDLRFDF